MSSPRRSCWPRLHSTTPLPRAPIRSTSIPPPAAGCSTESLGDDHAYRIPYRSLIAASFDNALVAGRGVSATHSALAAIRVMTISMAVGQAAGTAAALAARQPSPGGRRAPGRHGPVARPAGQDGACLQ